MRRQKSSKKRLKKLHATRPRRRTWGRGVNLERAANAGVIKLRTRINRLTQKRSVTHAQARQCGAEILRTLTRKYRLITGGDEDRHIQAALRECADVLTGHYHPELYEI